MVYHIAVKWHRSKTHQLICDAGAIHRDVVGRADMSRVFMTMVGWNPVLNTGEVYLQVLRADEPQQELSLIHDVILQHTGAHPSGRPMVSVTVRPVLREHHIVSSMTQRFESHVLIELVNTDVFCTTVVRDEDIQDVEIIPPSSDEEDDEEDDADGGEVVVKQEEEQQFADGGGADMTYEDFIQTMDNIAEERGVAFDAFCESVENGSRYADVQDSVLDWSSEEDEGEAEE